MGIDWNLNLWNVIRDFYVRNVFGGLDSAGDFYGGTWGVGYSDAEQGYTYDYGQMFFPIKGFSADAEFPIDWVSAGDWLSTSLTIITLCLLLFAVFLAIKFLFKLVAGSFLKIGE